MSTDTARMPGCRAARTTTAAVTTTTATTVGTGKVTTTDQSSRSNRSLRFLYCLSLFFHIYIFSYLCGVLRPSSSLHTYFIYIIPFFPYYFAAVTNLATSCSSFFNLFGLAAAAKRVPCPRTTDPGHLVFNRQVLRSVIGRRDSSKVSGLRARLFCELFNYRCEFSLFSL